MPIVKKGYKEDPVCKMVVPESQYALEFLQMHFAFCSLQCKQRFEQNPYLYIGHQGKKSVKQTGLEVIKKRSIKLDQPIDDEKIKKVLSAIQAMMGIRSVTVEDKFIVLEYDLLQATEKQIESEIEALGVILGKHWKDKIYRSFIQFLEDNECATLSGSGGKRCH